jgi:epoxyqueuosine reductase
MKYKELNYRFKTVSINHLEELKSYISALDKKGALSQNEVFRYYISSLSYNVPEEIPNAKSIIIIGIELSLKQLKFEYNNNIHTVRIPPNYCDFGFSQETVEDLILNEIIPEPGHKIVGGNRSVHLKHLAVRSGLALYGRNNICYVDGMGSFVTFFAFYSDFEFPNDDWQDIRMMQECENCNICRTLCPTKAIPTEMGIINIEKCIPLYNEILGDIPNWIDPQAHNALMGCLHCQLKCPANKEALNRTEDCGFLNERETKKILAGDVDEELLAKISKNSQGFCATRTLKHIPILTRNLELLLKN